MLLHAESLVSDDLGNGVGEGPRVDAVDCLALVAFLCIFLFLWILLKHPPRKSFRLN